MNPEHPQIIAIAAVFFCAVLLCLGILQVAAGVGRDVNLVDRPTARKLHVGNIPLVGGISIFLTFLALQFLPTGVDFYVLTAGTLLLMVGMADDYRELSARSRLMFQAAAAVFLVVVGGYQIVYLGALVSPEPVVLSGLFAIGFSVFCVIGVVNAINMIDGADCLAGGVVAISLCALIIASLHTHAHTAGGFHADTGLLVLLGATVAFLVFNSGVLGGQYKVFLGDSGSMFLGIMLASYFIKMSQGEGAPLSPVAAGWIFGLPLMDSISVMAGRVIKGRSPFKAGRDHLHHLLLDKGLSQRAVVIIILSLHLTLVSAGLITNHFALPSAVMFWGFVALVVAHFAVTPRLIQHMGTQYLRHLHGARN